MASYMFFPAASNVMSPRSHTFTVNYGNHSMSGLPVFNFPSAEERPMFYVAIYAFIGLTSVLGGLIAQIVQYLGGVRSIARLLCSGKRILIGPSEHHESCSDN